MLALTQGPHKRGVMDGRKCKQAQLAVPTPQPAVVRDGPRRRRGQACRPEPHAGTFPTSQPARPGAAARHSWFGCSMEHMQSAQNQTHSRTDAVAPARPYRHTGRPTPRSPAGHRAAGGCPALRTAPPPPPACSDRLPHAIGSARCRVGWGRSGGGGWWAQGGKRETPLRSPTAAAHRSRKDGLLQTPATKLKRTGGQQHGPRAFPSSVSLTGGSPDPPCLQRPDRHWSGAPPRRSRAAAWAARFLQRSRRPPPCQASPHGGTQAAQPKARSAP